MTVTKAQKSENRSLTSGFSKFKTFMPFVGLIIVFAIFAVITQGGIISHWKLVFSSAFVLIIASTGVFLIMTMGGLDFSQGSILGVSSLVVCAISQYNTVAAVIGGIVVGALIGLINGYFSVYRKIKSFIVTICTMFLFRGVVKFFTTKSPLMVDYNLIFADNFYAKIAVTVVILGVVFYFFRFTKFGIHFKAIGAGETAARFAGVRTDRTKFWIYVIAGSLTGFAAFLNVIKVGCVTSSAGNQLETQILIALVLGGMPISGGSKVHFSNIVVGSLLYTILNSGLIMVGVSTQALQLIEGVVFLGFVALFADREFLHIIK